MTVRIVLLVASAVVAAFLLWGTAGAGHASGYQASYVVSVAAAQFYGYATPAMVVEKGGELAYANLDFVQHDVVHDVKSDGVSNKKKAKWCKSFARGKCPLFWSPRAGLGDVVRVKGLKNLKPGTTYTFYCTLHPGMRGTLAVRP